MIDLPTEIMIFLRLGAAALIGAAIGLNRDLHGLTTAALIWLTACLGIVCGLGAWTVAIVASVFVFALLAGGGRLERRLHRRWGRHSIGNDTSGKVSTNGS